MQTIQKQTGGKLQKFLQDRSACLMISKTEVDNKDIYKGEIVHEVAYITVQGCFLTEDSWKIFW